MKNKRKINLGSLIAAIGVLALANQIQSIPGFIESWIEVWRDITHYLWFWLPSFVNDWIKDCITTGFIISGMQIRSETHTYKDPEWIEFRKENGWVMDYKFYFIDDFLIVVLIWPAFLLFHVTYDLITSLPFVDIKEGHGGKELDREISKAFWQTGLYTMILASFSVLIAKVWG